MSATELFKGHLLAVLSMLAVTIAALRVLVVSGGDEATLRALLATLDVKTVMLATLVPLLPLVVFYVCAYVEVSFWRGRWRTDSAVIRILRVVNPVIAIGVLALIPWLSMLILATVVVVLAAGHWGVNRVRVRRGRDKHRAERYWNAVIGLQVLALLVTLFISRSMWLAPQVLVVRGQPPQIVYVLEKDTRQLTVLVHDTTRVLTIERDEVESLAFCSLERRTWPSVASWLDGRSDRVTPRCP